MEEAIVVGLATDGRTTEVHAVLLSGDLAVVEAAIQRTNEQLTEFQRTRGFSVWPGEEFPRTRTLRVQRHLVTEHLEQDQTRKAPPPQKIPLPNPMSAGLAVRWQRSAQRHPRR